jgi:hypothetical protein
VTDPAAIDAGSDRAGTEMVCWVNRSLIDGHELWDMIPACWAEHPGAAAELAALYEWSEGAVAGPALIAWYDALARTVDRIRTLYPTGECLRKRQHVVPQRWRGQPDQRAAVRAAARR